MPFLKNYKALILRFLYIHSYISFCYTNSYLYIKLRPYSKNSTNPTIPRTKCYP